MKSIIKSNILLLIVVLSLSACEPANREVPLTKVFNTSGINPLHIRNAAKYVGYNEKKNRKELKKLMGIDPVRTEWCAAFINTVLNLSNIRGSESISDTPLMARSFLKWGLSVNEPQRGDIVVFERGNSGWQGHVAIYMGTVERNGKFYYRTLGGNQNNSINVSEYPVSKLLGIRRIQKIVDVKIALN